MAEKLIILGSGPAGWTAAIYAARANLDPVVLEGGHFEGDLPGGQLMLTTEVENYPGFPNGIDGTEMMAAFKAQAKRFDVRIEEYTGAESVDLSVQPFKVNDSNGKTWETHALIISTGASANWLGLESEQYYRKKGLGVTACATCDGAFPRFRDKPVAVVGGGDTAVEEASYMTKFSNPVYVIHRRDTLRASKIMQERLLKNPKIQPVWDSVVEEVLGNDSEGVTGLRLQNVKTGETKELSVSGLFLAIGHTPNTAFLKGQVETDAKGYIVLADPFGSQTGVEGVFAAGDVADSTYRQAITAAGMGCKAAIDAERWLAEKGID
ncbi:MAG: thioredoxin-disulfide reductase [Candidatus Omnitrophica bacterium]|nr:Thioredoxin reductase [bacterium]NUN96203.1 thioredoxin-disulfide reductase [Candidatus Omnitrophota bacterium]